MLRPLTIAAATTMLLAAVPPSTAAEAPGAKPVLTESIDEPGRTPYQLAAFSDPSHCDKARCELVFSPVPAGRRLVILYASVSFSFVPSGSVRALLTDRVNTAPLPLLSNMPFGDAVNGVFGGDVRFYVESGVSPRIETFNHGADVLAFVSGYLVAE